MHTYDRDHRRRPEPTPTARPPIREVPISDLFDNPDPDDDASEDDAPEIDGETLRAIQGIGHMVEALDWFAVVGAPLTPRVRSNADAYLAALGFADLGVAALPDWHEAVAALEHRRWDSTWNEAEDQARSALAARAVEIAGSDVVGAAVDHVATRTAAAATNALRDPAPPWAAAAAPLVEAAVEDARNAACQALLIALTDAGPDHPLALKFRLFEAGHWPIGAVGGSFNLF